MFNITQQEGESAKKYITKFSQPVAYVNNPRDRVVMKAFTRGISSITRSFFHYIIWDNLYTKVDQFTRCEIFLESEDDFLTRIARDKTPKEPSLEIYRDD